LCSGMTGLCSGMTGLCVGVAMHRMSLEEAAPAAEWLNGHKKMPCSPP
jgi:hypothetical protein